MTTACNCQCNRYAPNSKFVLASTLDSTIRLWTATNPARCVKTYRGHTASKYCAAAAFVIAGRASGQRLIGGSEDCRVCVWDVQTREITQRLEGHVDAVLAVDCHPTHDLIASGGMSNDRTVRIWADYDAGADRFAGRSEGANDDGDDAGGDASGGASPDGRRAPPPMTRTTRKSARRVSVRGWRPIPPNLMTTAPNPTPPLPVTPPRLFPRRRRNNDDRAAASSCLYSCLLPLWRS